MAMLAGMQLDVFTPLKDGPMTAKALANALDVRPEKLRPLLYALVRAELLLKFEGDRFANTPEADAYLVRGRATYMGGTHEFYSDLWGTALKAAGEFRRLSQHPRQLNRLRFRLAMVPPRVFCYLERYLILKTCALSHNRSVQATAGLLL
jgi:hypothetical protein